MPQFPETRESLIAEVKNPENREAWEQFISIYRPAIFRAAVKRGLQDADAQDLAQQVLLAVASAIGDWERRDPSTRFRHWLRTVTRNAIVNALTRYPKDRAAGGSTVQQLLAQHQQADLETESIVDWEFRRQLYRQAAKIVRRDVQEETWLAFQLTVVEGMSSQAAAKRLGKSLGTIYTARCRVMQRLRKVIGEMEGLEG